MHCFGSKVQTYMSLSDQRNRLTLHFKENVLSIHKQIVKFVKRNFPQKIASFRDECSNLLKFQNSLQWH